MNWLLDKLKPPTQDIKTVGSFIFDKIKPPVKDIKIISETLPQTKTPFEAIKKMTVEPALKFFKPTEDVRVRDVARELPDVFGGTLKAVAVDIPQEIARYSGGGIGMSLLNLFADIKDPSGKSRRMDYQPTKDDPVIERALKLFIFGEKAVKPSEQLIVDAGNWVAEQGEKGTWEAGKERKGAPWFEKIARKGVMEGLEKHPMVAGMIAVPLITALDFTGFGGTGKHAMKNAFKYFSKADNLIDVSKPMIKMGIPEDIVKIAAPEIVKMKNPLKIEKAFEKIIRLSKTTKVTPAFKTKAIKSIHPSDQKKMVEFIDNVRLKKPKNIDLELDATRIAENYNLKMPSTKVGLANEFDDVLSSMGKSYESFAKGRGKVISETLPKAKPSKLLETMRRPQVIDDLAVEARKYKTADEFVKKVDNAIQDVEKNLNLPKGFRASKENERLFNLVAEKRAMTENAIRDIYSKAKTLPEAKKGILETIKAKDGIKLPIKKITAKKPSVKPIKNVPVVIQGKTFTLGPSELIQPTKKKLRTALKLEIKATKKEMKNAEIARKKAEKLVAREQKIRTDTIEKIDRQHGNTDKIIESLKKKHLSQEDIDNIVLENGVKLTDTVKVKRNADKSLATVITKQDIQAIKDSYTSVIPSKKWAKIGKLEGAIDKGIDISRLYELPYVFFERKGLNKLYDPIIEATRGSEILKTSFIKRFDDAGLWKKQGWFTADRFNLSSKESSNIGKYFLSRQSRGYKVALSDLSIKEKKFVEVFDGIIKDTEQRFFEVAKKVGKSPGEVENYAPIMTREDIEMIDKAGAMDFIFKKHPSFFSLKERAKKVPAELYETDYRKVSARWIDGITEFLNIGESTQDIKYLIDSDQFKNIVTNKDYSIIHKWLKDITVPQIPETAGGQAVDFVARLLRKTAAVASLGLNYATVVKQALTQIPITIIGKAPPKLKSQYAKAFNISVKNLPSLTKRKGDIAIADLQGRTGRIFTGAITEFDRLNAQLSLNALLDKEYYKFLKKGADITPETQRYIEKIAQDKLDMWYGGFFKGQRPEAFRNSVGQFLNMFIYPLTSQLNGFYRNILTAKGVGETAKATAEVMAAATAIAYMEVAITRLSPRWSDEQEMTKDVLQSLLGNIPIISQISYALMEDQQLQVSAGISGITNLLKRITAYNKGDKELIDVMFAGAEVAGLPKQIRRVKEGMEIVEKGGITDKSGKILAPVKEADEIVRSFLRGRYGSLASQDWIRNIGEKKENRRWFIPQVEFLQNGDYERKVELYNQFTPEEQEELRGFLSEGQLKKLDDTIKKGKVKPTYDRIQKLIEEDRIDEAKRLLNELSDEDYETYKKLKSAGKRMETIKKEEEFTSTFERIQELKNEGKTEEAKKMLEDLSDEEYEIYKKMKATK